MQATAAKAQADLDDLLNSMQAARDRFAHAQEQQRRTTTAQRKVEHFQRKQREGKFSLDPSKRAKWRASERYTPQELGSNKVYLPPSDITATELYRVTNLIPRSYAKPSTAFLLTRNTCDMFPRPSEGLLSRNGLTTLNQRRKLHDKEVDRRRREEMKLKVVEFGPRWEPTSTKGDLLSGVPSDPVNYYSRDLPPKYLQQQPFLRTNRTGGFFSKPDSVNVTLTS
jgi:hypothetical protein